MHIILGAQNQYTDQYSNSLSLLTCGPNSPLVENPWDSNQNIMVYVLINKLRFGWFEFIIWDNFIGNFFGKLLITLLSKSNPLASFIQKILFVSPLASSNYIMKIFDRRFYLIQGFGLSYLFYALFILKMKV